MVGDVPFFSYVDILILKPNNVWLKTDSLINKMKNLRQYRLKKKTAQCSHCGFFEMIEFGLNLLFCNADLRQF